MIHRSYEIAKCCENCKSVFVYREACEPDTFYCNSDRASIPSCLKEPEDEDEDDEEYDPKKDEYEHWTTHRLVDYNGYCDNYKQEFIEMISVKS